MGTHVSNSSSTWLNNNQRKFVRTPNCWMHMVYESMWRVWYEASSDNGSTWQIMNGGKPIDNSTGRSSSIDWCLTMTGGYQIIIAFQEGTYIRVRSFGYISNAPYVNGPESYIPTGESATANVTPNIAWHSSRTFMVLWKKSTGLAYTCGFLDGFCMEVISNTLGTIYGSNGSSSGAAISTDKSWDTPFFDVAWEQLGTVTSEPPPVSIKTCMLVFVQTRNICCGGAPMPCGFDGYVQQEPLPPQLPLTVSHSTMKRNSNISIISFPEDSWICWIADYSGTFDPWQTKSVLRNPWTGSTTRSYSYYCKSTSINKRDDNSGFYFTFSAIFNMPGWIDYNYVIAGNDLSTYRNVNTKGRDVQICNGSSASNMYVTAYYPTIQPFYFQQSNSLAAVGLSKTSAQITQTAMQSRGVVIENNGAGLYYSVGNIMVDGQPISFIEPEKKTSRFRNKDTMQVRITADSVNTLWVSESFELTEKSQISFGDEMSIGDSTLADALLGSGSNVSFKIELMDATSDKVLGTVKERKLNKGTLFSNKPSAYVLKSKGLKAQNVRLRILLMTNIENPNFAIINSYMPASERQNGLNKLAEAEEITLQTNTITEYALAQNYPNPFNPTTAISYQFSAVSNVTLKVYDILGREVATLASGMKDAGYYTATFNASHLSSGVYFVRLTCESSDSKPFTRTIKILLTK